jgi:SAM-dependent methyltransferase
MSEDHEKNTEEKGPLNPWKASDYLEKWNAHAYLSFYNIDQNGAVPPMLNFQISNLIKILDQHAIDMKLNKTEQTVLEFGGGPCLWSALLLAQYFNKIWFCDFTPSNLQCVQDWLDEKSDAFNWKPFFNYILDIKQGHHDNEIEYETKLRSALQNGQIFRCDVNGKNSLFIDDSVNNEQQFDMIYSSCCLESACSSYDIFRQTIRRLSDLLKPGGLLLICNYRNSTLYVFNGDKFTDLPLTEEIIRTAFVETDHLTEPICISIDSQPDPTHNITNDGLMINYGFKKGEK